MTKTKKNTSTPETPIIYTFEEAMEIAQSNVKNKLTFKDIRLLLGNGFSKAYYGEFSYTTLFDAIKNEKDNQRIKKVFEYFGTSNFELVLKSLKDTQFINQIYGISAGEVTLDYERVRDALAEAILKVHPENTGAIPEQHKLACHAFLNRFDDVYTVNYDLLLYWTVLQTTPPLFGDYFYRDEDTPQEYCEYFGDGGKSGKHIFFLHGALHLFLHNGRTIKKVWGSTVPLIEQIKTGIENGYYPHVVTEGDSQSKLNQIRSNPYLDHAYTKLLMHKGQLFTFGFSFSEQDKHISDAIAKNKGLKYLWIGIRGDFSREENQKILSLANAMMEHRLSIVGEQDKQGVGPLIVKFYNAGDLDIWGKTQVLKRVT